MTFMSLFFLILLVNEPYDLSRKYDLIWRLNKGREGMVRNKKWS